MEDFFGLVPAIFLGILSIVFFINAEKEYNDYVNKIWTFVLGIAAAIVTVCMINMYISYKNSNKQKNINKIEYYDRYYY